MNQQQHAGKNEHKQNARCPRKHRVQPWKGFRKSTYLVHFVEMTTEQQLIRGGGKWAAMGENSRQNRRKEDSCTKGDRHCLATITCPIQCQRWEKEVAYRGVLRRANE
eukprot:3032445-Pleurochrysis_carterae.AAC.1